LRVETAAFPELGTRAEALMDRSRGPDFHSLRSKPISTNHRKIVTSSRFAVSCISPASSLFSESYDSHWKEENPEKKPDKMKTMRSANAKATSGNHSLNHLSETFGR
jgi:hypothetical protein